MPARTELDPHAPRGEGFGIVYLEAMARGKPVLGPTTGAPAEFIQPHKHGLLVNPSDSGEIAEALIYLLEKPQEDTPHGRKCPRVGPGTNLASNGSVNVCGRRCVKGL